MKKTVLGCAAIVLATFIAYIPAIRGDYVWDDDLYVYDNPLLPAADGFYRIWFTKDSPSQYFPLTYTSFKIEYALWKTKPLGYHLDNVLLHCINALLVWLLLFRLSIPFAWFAAALFALHPVQVESVAWITERKNLLSTLFYLLALLSWLKFAPQSFAKTGKYFFLSLFSFTAALFAKTTACTLPAVLILMRWYKKEKVTLREWMLVGVFLILGIGMGLVTVWWETHKHGTEGAYFNLSLLEKLLVATHAVWFYFGKLLWPWPLIFSYGMWNIDVHRIANYFWVVLTLIFAGFLFWQWRKQQRWPAIAGLFFIAVLSPMLGFIKLYTFMYSYVADHYQYLACLAPIAVLSVFLGRMTTMKNAPVFVRPLLFGTMLLIAGTLTWKQSHIYKDEETCWRDTISKNPKSWMAHNNLGVILQKQNRLEESEVYFSEALRLKPDYVAALSNLGTIYRLKGFYDKAYESFSKALAIDSTRVPALSNMGMLLASMEKYSEAVTYYERALHVNNTSSELENLMGYALQYAGKQKEAEFHYRKALKIQPEYDEAMANLATLLFDKNNSAESITLYKNAIKINPSNIAALSNLGVLYLKSFRFDDAINCFEQALRIHPEFAEIHCNLGQALEESGRRDDAIQQYTIAIRLNPTIKYASQRLSQLKR